MNVSIVILNWNRKKDTLDCLKSIEKLKVVGFKLQIVVVDNNSSDGSQKTVEEYFKKTPSINGVLLRNRENFGFAKGNNQGIKYSIEKGCEYILVLNNDTLVNEDLFVGLIKVVEERASVGAISPKIYFAPGFEFHKSRYKKSNLGKVIWYAGGEIDWDNVYGKNRGVDEVDMGQYNKIEKTDFATGACVLLRTKALNEVGLFDEKYYMYMEDVDLSQRLKKKGWKVLFAPVSCIWHKVAQSSGIGSNLNDYYTTRNRLLFGFKYARFKTKIALIKESILFLIKSRKWQRKGVVDYYLCRLGKGSYRS
jgi:GT2 family glycosyltransferase